jgi:hypothetical protein
MYKIAWSDDDHTTVYIEFEGKWQSDELNAAEHRLHDMLSNVGHSVALVVNIPHPRPIPMAVLEGMRRLLDFHHPNRGDVVVVTEPRHLPAFQEVIRRTFGGSLPPHLTLSDNLDTSKA